VYSPPFKNNVLISSSIEKLIFCTIDSIQVRINPWQELSIPGRIRPEQVPVRLVLLWGKFFPLILFYQCNSLSPLLHIFFNHRIQIQNNTFFNHWIQIQNNTFFNHWIQIQNDILFNHRISPRVSSFLRSSYFCKGIFVSGVLVFCKGISVSGAIAFVEGISVSEALVFL